MRNKQVKCRSCGAWVNTRTNRTANFRTLEDGELAHIEVHCRACDDTIVYDVSEMQAPSSKENKEKEVSNV